MSDKWDIMIAVKKHGVILEKTEIEFENSGVLNPAVYQDGNTLHMFYQAVRDGDFSCIGYCKLDGPLKVIERAVKPKFWKEYIRNLQDHIVMMPKFKHQNSHIGAGCPPIETEYGWLIIYHSAQYAPKGYIYHACAALLDLNNPLKLIGRLKTPLFSPTEIWEKEGYVSNIVFPSGTALFGEDLYIYYGTADSRVAVASVNMNELLQKLKKQ
jgi:hypothetical protein